MKFFNMAMEAEETSNKETEIALYAHIGDMEGFSHAVSSIQQEQLDSEFFNGVKCRVRKETIGTETTHTLTYKVKQKSNSALSSNIEYNLAVTPEFFEGFRHAAKKRVKKTRYLFNSKRVELKLVPAVGEPVIVTLPKITYEVDVYQKADNTPSEWCKIDVEFDSLLEAISKNVDIIDKEIKVLLKVSHLPFKPALTIMGNSKNPKDLAVINKVWDEEWKLPVFEK
jgi:hypothetical protein